MSEPEEKSVATSNVEVLLEVRELRGQVSTFIQLMTSQGEQLKTVDAKVSTLDNRVTAIEAAQTARAKASPPWWTWLAVAVPTVAFILQLAKDLYT